MTYLKTDYHGGNRIEIPAEMDDHPVSLLLSMYWDGHDVWGSAMSEGFGLCDYAVAERGIMPPSDLGYQMSMAGPDADDPIYELLVECGDSLTNEEISEYLLILDRFLDACKAAGVDY